ncbi:MAG: tetratricopeptide repeat protein [candidate division KSB1 bacterium]|nr:tetratricopeptide repeat protein [candidate division KSB1 bacterium]
MRHRKSKVLIVLLTGIYCVWLSVEALTQPGEAVFSQLKLAQEYEQLGDYNKALEIYRSLFNRNPQNATIYEGLKRNLLRLKLYDEAISITESRLKDRYDFRLQIDLAEIYYKSGRTEEALRLWNEVIQNQPRDINVYREVANRLLNNGLFDEAVKVYQKGREKVNNPDVFTLELANLYTIRMDYRNAVLEYLKYLKQNPDQLAFVEARIASFTDDPEVADQVARIIWENVQPGKQGLPLRKLLAGLFLRTGDYNSALEEYKIIDDLLTVKIKKETEGQELFTFAQNALREKAYFHAEQAFSLIISKYPNSPYITQARYGLARCYQLQGLHYQALQAYSDLLNSSPRTPQAQDALFQIGEIKLNQLLDPEGARIAFTSLLEKYPASDKQYEAMFGIGDCLVAQGQLAEARAWYQRPLTEVPQDMRRRISSQEVAPKALYELARLDFVEEKFDSALEKLSQIYKGSPETGLTLNQALVNDALELTLLIEENRTNDKTLNLYAQAILLERQHRYEQALDKLKALSEKNSQAPIVDEALLKMGQLQYQLKHFQTAIATYRKLISEYPKSLYVDLAQKRIAEVYEQGLGDLKQAQQEYELFLVNYPQSLLVEEVRKKVRMLEKHLE